MKNFEEKSDEYHKDLLNRYSEEVVSLTSESFIRYLFRNRQLSFLRTKKVNRIVRKNVRKLCREYKRKKIN